MSARYEVLGLIAEGGLGTVFRARDRQSGREVALKRLRPDKAGARGATAAHLLEEARQQAGLRHPNIVAVQDAGMDEEGPFVAMELVRGETLEAVVQRGPLPLPAFDSLVRQSLEGMAAAHEAGIIHLDLKPENLMLQPRPQGTGASFQVKILDFGLARAAGAGSGIAGTAPQAGRQGLLGSVHFMAPEQFENAMPDARTDLYALGCVFYYALAQRRPFDGDTSPQVIVAHRHHHLAPLAAARPDVPASITRWVEWLMSRQPADRPASMREALHSYLAAADPQNAP